MTKRKEKVSDAYQKEMIKISRAIRKRAELFLKIAKQNEEFLLFVYGDLSAEKQTGTITSEATVKK